MPFDPDAYLAAKPSGGFDPDAYLARSKAPEADKPDPASFQHLLGHPKEGVTGNQEPPDTRSETEKRLTADNLRALLAARSGDRSLSDMLTGSEARHEGSLTERATDWLIPGAKNVMGGALSLGRGLVTGEGTAGENWRAGVNAEKQFREQNRADTAGPLGYAADTAGVLASGGRAGPAISSTASMGAPTVTTGAEAGSSVLNAAKTQGTLGAISGAAENSQSWGDAAKGGVVGGAAGAGTGAVTQGLIGRLAANKAAAAERQGMRGTSPDEYFTQASGKFKELDAAGIQFDRGQAKQLGRMLPQVLQDANYTATSARELEGALKAVEKAGSKKAPPLTFTELQALRGKVNEAAQANPLNPNLRRIASRVTGMIDDFVENNVPNINQSGADLAKLYPEARKLFRTGVLGDTIQDVEKIAAVKSATGTSNASDLERKAVGAQAIKDIKSGYSQLNPAAQEARQAVIEGSPKLETAARVAKSWPVQAGLGIGSATAASAMGLPNTGVLGTTVIGPGIGQGVSRLTKHFADKNTANNMDGLVRAIMTGSADAPASWDMSRQMLARLIANRAGQTAASQGVAGTVAAKRKDYSQ